jgi:hypothetical protein
MVRIVLPDATPRDTLDDAAADLGLALVNIVSKTEAHPAQLIYVTPDRRAQVHLVDEGAGGALCYVVQGDEVEEARWSGALRARFEVAS